MSWTHEIKPHDGFPIWRGKDAIWMATGFSGKHVGPYWTLAVKLLKTDENGYKKPAFIFRKDDKTAPNAETPPDFIIPIEDVSRVEVAKTSEYYKSRKYKRGFGWIGDDLYVTNDEWQAFLFLNDGTRAEIYHGEQMRDQCGALAASIRQFIGQHNAASSGPTAASAPDAPPPSPPQGFDL